ncbi:hypothetical protein B0H11DRAFT_2260330 [Mycena galericulata]|nr:hypothetical protein B0H11DRAFT_2260330 [Mycena galericulata]
MYDTRRLLHTTRLRSGLSLLEFQEWIVPWGSVRRYHCGYRFARAAGYHGTRLPANRSLGVNGCVEWAMVLLKPDGHAGKMEVFQGLDVFVAQVLWVIKSYLSTSDIPLLSQTLLALLPELAPSTTLPEIESDLLPDVYRIAHLPLISGPRAPCDSTRSLASIDGCCSRIRHARWGFASAARNLKAAVGYFKVSSDPAATLCVSVSPIVVTYLTHKPGWAFNCFSQSQTLLFSSSCLLSHRTSSKVRLRAGNTAASVLVDKVASSRVRLRAGKTAASVLGDAPDIVQVGFARATAASVLRLRSTSRPSRLRAGNRSECLATDARLQVGFARATAASVLGLRSTSRPSRLRVGNTTARDGADIV